MWPKHWPASVTMLGIQGSHGPFKSTASFFDWIHFKTVPHLNPSESNPQDTCRGPCCIVKGTSHERVSAGWVAQDYALQENLHSPGSWQAWQPMTQTPCPAHSLSHSLLQPLPALFSQCSARLTLPACSKPQPNSPSCTSFSRLLSPWSDMLLLPLPPTPHTSGGTRVFLSHLLRQGSLHQLSAAANDCHCSRNRPTFLSVC